MQEILTNPITWMIFAAATEIIALAPLKDNSIIQVVLKAELKLKPAVKK